VANVSQLRQLAKAAGLDPDYISWTGERTTSSDASLLAAIKALSPGLGLQVDSDDDVRGALTDLEHNRWVELVPPVVVGWDGALVVPLSVAADRDGDWEVEITTESGRTFHARGRLFDLPADSHSWPGGRAYCVRHATIWLDHELGYHRVSWRVMVSGARGGSHGEAMGIAAPTRAYGGPGGSRRWGVFAPIYGLASSVSGEAGDLGSLHALFEAVHRRGGRYVATLPILAAFLDEPCAFSPYSPASRMFWNELYLDLGALAAEVGLPAPVAPPRGDGPLIDYRAQHRWRHAALAPIARRLLDSRGGEIDDWATANDVHDYAAFRALVETTRTSWQRWPAMWRDDLPLVQRREDAVRAGVDGDRLDLHVVAQWAMQRQLETLARDRPDIHLYLDLPVGVSCDAYEVWRDRHLFLTTLAAGAPPDPLFLGGQNWGLPPVSPMAARRDRYRYIIRCIRHHMRVSGMLRIDHVMGLFRLYVVPEGRPATDGVYLRYHPEELLAILALESNRNHCAVVGEDLGTVPDHVRPAMQRHAMFRIHVGQWFLPTQIGVRPEPAPAESIASLNTHDTATFAGWWNGADIDDAHDLGLIDDEVATRDRATRVSARAATLALAERPANDPLTDVERALVSATADLAAGPAEVMLVSLDDLVLDPVPHNVPGTTSERPNWLRRVGGWETTLDADKGSAVARATIDAVIASRSR